MHLSLILRLNGILGKVGNSLAVSSGFKVLSGGDTTSCVTMGLKEANIYFDNQWNTYYAGQTVNGRIEYVFDSPKKVRGMLCSSYDYFYGAIIYYDSRISWHTKIKLLIKLNVT